MSSKTRIVEVLGGVFADKAPDLIAQGLDDLAAEQDDQFARDVLDLLSGFVADNGGEAIVALSDELQSLIDGSDPMAIYAIRGDSRYETAQLLTELVDVLQDVEAERRKRVSRMLDMLAAVLADIGKVAGKALAAAVVKA